MATDCVTDGGCGRVGLMFYEGVIFRAYLAESVEEYVGVP